MNEPCYKCGSKRRQEYRNETYGLLLQHWKCIDCGACVKTKARTKQKKERALEAG
jgi:Fe-S-cluster-containing dehydrogenase component